VAIDRQNSWYRVASLVIVMAAGALGGGAEARVRCHSASPVASALKAHRPLSSCRGAESRSAPPMTTTAKRYALLVLLGLLAFASTYWGFGYLAT
jgi:hypothetical protein